MFRYTALVTAILMAGCSSMPTDSHTTPPEFLLPTSAPLTTDSAGKQADAAKHGVLRVVCRSTGLGGTGFLHNSGAVLTAAHVVAGCQPKDLLLLTSSGQSFGVSNVVADGAKDLALLRPVPALPGSPLTISSIAVPVIGAQVTTWGFPGGYDGLAPLLSVGYLSGVQEFPTASGTTVHRWVVNAAFNGGNSGGPLLSVEDGRVIGVVSSKLAPLPPFLAQVLKVLGEQKSGMQYGLTRPDGSNTSVSEAQLVAEVLNYLRSQVQLVIGYSVTTKDLSEFLKANAIAP